MVTKLAQYFCATDFTMLSPLGWPLVSCLSFTHHSSPSGNSSCLVLLQAITGLFRCRFRPSRLISPRKHPVIVARLCLSNLLAPKYQHLLSRAWTRPQLIVLLPWSAEGVDRPKPPRWSVKTMTTHLVVIQIEPDLLRTDSYWVREPIAGLGNSGNPSSADSAAAKISWRRGSAGATPKGRRDT